MCIRDRSYASSTETEHGIPIAGVIIKGNDVVPTDSIRVNINNVGFRTGSYIQGDTLVTTKRNVPMNEALNNARAVSYTHLDVYKRQVQGWEDRNMADHAFLMTSAIKPHIVVLTNVALDHVGLVNTIEDVSKEISSSLRGFQGKQVILNHDDPLIRKMENLVPNAEVRFYGSGTSVEFRKNGIFYKEKLIIPLNDLPFKSSHFIQNTLAAVSTSIALKINLNIIKRAVESYQPLKRRFTVLNHNPLIIDDFAHNPEGIAATIKSTTELVSGKFHIVCAIRGSRGSSLNKLNAQAVANSIKKIDYNLILTSSEDVVDNANRVKPVSYTHLDVYKRQALPPWVVWLFYWEQHWLLQYIATKKTCYLPY